MEQNKDRLSIDVAKLYYKSDYSQQQIANKLNLSRPTVSRLLQYAKEKGFVQINICLLYTSPSPRDKRQSRMPSSA